MCWCGDHKCYENDEQNSFMGVDPVYLWKIVSDKAVEKNNYKYQMFDFDSDKMADVRTTSRKITEITLSINVGNVKKKVQQSLNLRYIMKKFI